MTYLIIMSRVTDKRRSESKYLQPKCCKYIYICDCLIVNITTFIKKNKHELL